MVTGTDRAVGVPAGDGRVEPGTAGEGDPGASNGDDAAAEHVEHVEHVPIKRKRSRKR